MEVETDVTALVVPVATEFVTAVTVVPLVATVVPVPLVSAAVDPVTPVLKQVKPHDSETGFLVR